MLWNSNPAPLFPPAPLAPSRGKGLGVRGSEYLAFKEKSVSTSKPGEPRRPTDNRKPKTEDRK